MLALAAAWLLAMPASAGPRSPLPEETNVVETERSRIAEYAKQLDETNRLVAAKQAEIARLDRETETLERLVAGAKRRIGLGGSETVGTAFLRELIRVREARALVRVAEADRTTELDLELRGLDLADRSQALGDLDAAIADCLDDAAVPAGDGRAPLADALRPLLIEQRDKHVGPLLESNRTAIETLESLEASQTKLLATIEDYRTFIVGNLFWLRVTQPSGPVRFGEGAAATVKLLADAPWQASLAAVSRMIAKEPLPWLGVAAVVGLLLAARPRCGRGLSRIAARVADDRSDRFTLSLEATLITALLAAPLPLAMWFVYRQLTSEDSGDLLAAAVGSGFYRLFQLVILVSATLALTRRDGLAVVHFGWSERIRGTVRRAAWILSGTVAPMLFLSSILVLGIDAGPAGASASQTLTMVAAIGWTITLAGLARPDRGLVPLGAASRGPWEKRFRRPFFALAVGVPLVLTIASWQGYLFAAIIGMEKIASSLLVLLGVRTARELCLRWIAATTRTIERQRESSPAEIAPNPPSPAEPQLEFDLGATNVQAGRVIGSIAFTVLILGTLAVWSDLLPALDGLKRIELWSIAEPAAAGAAATRVPVNLLDALSSALALLLTVIFTRNMPGLIELIVLPRLPLEAGARYAIVTIIRYAIGIVGGVVVLRFLGVNWNSVQWLASAAVLGLSFGLQEIFKNLVSGVILLFEQPIRVGDRVSIGGVSGSVTSIRMRATTVVDSDLRDLIIPNSAFITGTVTNWTLSDLKTQQTIRIPVAYGSDARVVEEALLKIALAEPEVARNPAPTVTLAEFGEKSMHFDLSVEIDDIAKMPAPAHRIRLAAAEELPKLGVKLAGGG